MATGPEGDGESPSFQVAVKTMFGERVSMTVTNTDSISSLKQKITRKLNVPEDGFSLLHNTKELTDGRVLDYGIDDSSELVVALRIQSGMMGFATVSNPLLTIDQSLNSLSDKQIDEFLTGKVPLSVALRLGDAMLVINVQSSLGAKDSDKKVDSTEEETDDMCDSRTASNPSSSAPNNNTINCTGFPLYASKEDNSDSTNSSNTGVREAGRAIIKNTLCNMISKLFPEGVHTVRNVKDVKAGDVLHTRNGGVTYELKSKNKSCDDRTDKRASVLTKSKFEDNQKLREKVEDLRHKMATERARKKARRSNGASPCGWLEKSIQAYPPSSIPSQQKGSGYCGLKRGFLLAD